MPSGMSDLIASAQSLIKSGVEMQSFSFDAGRSVRQTTTPSRILSQIQDADRASRTPLSSPFRKPKAFRLVKHFSKARHRLPHSVSHVKYVHSVLCTNVSFVASPLRKTMNMCRSHLASTLGNIYYHILSPVLPILSSVVCAETRARRSPLRVVSRPLAVQDTINVRVGSRILFIFGWLSAPATVSTRCDTQSSQNNNDRLEDGLSTNTIRTEQSAQAPYQSKSRI
jgi:hypothetical protein